MATKTYEIQDWQNIKGKYNFPNLLLGNGFSMSFSSKFGYNSLFETFINKVGEPFKTLFKQFGTTNFELILNYLKHAQKVNAILGLDTDLIDKSILSLKNGLIDALNDIHPKADSIDWNRLNYITRELEEFGDIFSTNYDLYLYHIIMISNDLYRDGTNKKAYQDYYWGGINEGAPKGYKKFMNYQNLMHYKHVYYLHGAIFLFNQNIFDFKITRTSEELIDTVAKQIKNGHFPLFVTEGAAKDKVSSILRSNYLYFCMQQFINKSGALLIYGNSLSDVDEHIVSAILKNPRDIIISVYTEGKDNIQLQSEIYSLLSKFPKYSHTIEFVDSSTIFPN